MDVKALAGAVLHRCLLRDHPFGPGQVGRRGDLEVVGRARDQGDAIAGPAEDLGIVQRRWQDVGAKGPVGRKDAGKRERLRRLGAPHPVTADGAMGVAIVVGLVPQRVDHPFSQNGGAVPLG